jgi:hypothetical protein
VSWSAQQDHEHDAEREHRIEPPEQAEREHERPLHQLASDVGNHAFGNTLAREGAGIKPTGEVHPEVQGKIDATRGSGTGLDAGVRGRFEDRLIAHELAHVVQQRGAANTGPLTVSEPGDALETEADSVADSIL